MKNVLITTLIGIVLIIGCNTSNERPDAIESAVLRDYTGLDGCGWVIELETGEVLEPTNLGAFDFVPTEGRKIAITYHEIEGALGICMVGPIVEIDALIVK